MPPSPENSPKPWGVPRPPCAPVAVEIDAGRAPAVGRGGEKVGVVRAPVAQRLAQRRQRREPCVMVHVEEQEDIRIGRRDDVERRENLRVVPPQRCPAAEGRARRGTGRYGKPRMRRGSAAAEAGSAVSATRQARADRRSRPMRSAGRGVDRSCPRPGTIASPRMSMLSGMNIHSVIPQTNACGEDRTSILDMVGSHDGHHGKHEWRENP